MADGNGQQRISLSHDLLRAELAELELRLRDHLASRTSVTELERRMDDFQRRSVFRDGPLIDQFREYKGKVDHMSEYGLTQDGVERMIAEAFKGAETRGWTSRERSMGVVLFAITLVSFLLNIASLGPDLWGG